MNTMLLAQPQITRVEPPNWWVGMNNSQLQLIVQGKNLAGLEFKIDYPGVILQKVTVAENPNFLFLDLQILPEAVAGTLKIDFYASGKKKKSVDYVLKDRNTLTTPILDQSDLVYLITPDRFANGDPESDKIKGLKEGVNRLDIDGRHGGDIKGISSKLDYIQDLGVTALWMTPMLVNDMPSYSYHGYAITDYYKIDPRIGTNESFKKLTDDLHAKDMKMVMDIVLNHCGSEHWWMKDMPFQDWINNHPYKVNTNHAKSSFSDTHAAESDKLIMEQGWFVETMPDLNQRNPFMANYLTYNTLWWIEYLGLNGLRIDTYPYNYAPFLKEWSDRIYQEYPGFFITGESWVDDPAILAFWAKKAPDFKGFNSGASSTKDFALCFSMHQALIDGGDITKVYDVLSKDFLYYEPESNLIFLDNHDMDRFFYTIGEDLDKFKMAITMLMTTRGVPQIYYGTEILMKKFGHHGDLREDFPGGWATDSKNAFISEGRTDKENEAFDYVKKVANWRKSSKAIHQGTLKHFLPINNVYVYCRTLGNERVLVLVNNNTKAQTLNMSRFAEVIKESDSARDVVTDEVISDLSVLELAPYSSRILTLEANID